MKRQMASILAMGLAAGMAFGVTGCGSGKKADAAAAGEGEEQRRPPHRKRTEQRQPLLRRQKPQKNRNGPR